jgi:ribonuclease HI
MIDDVAGFTVYYRNYDTTHQLAKPSCVFSVENSAIKMALEHIQICPRGRYLILSDSLSSPMAMRSRRITCKTHPWVYESKQIYWDLQQLNYDVKAMWIPSHVGISGNEDVDGLARQVVESGIVHGQMTVANDHRGLAEPAMIKQWQHVWRTEDTGRFTHAIRPLVSVKPWFDGQTEEKSFVTTISRVMSGYCSIRAHLERFRIVGDPICVCMMNYETVDRII